ncbi:MAG: zinc carboxypeptidase [Rhodothermales bacterium]|nr:zinc carboxypeptidase [Rhodothermales bacterium]
MYARLLSLAAFLILVAAPAHGQNTDYFFPEGTAFDESIPSPSDFLGYDIGSFHTRHDRIVAYLQELADLSDRATYQSIGMTYEHRPMPVLTVTTPENHARLEEIRTSHLASLKPGAEVPADLPAIVHLGYGVHGNETSSAEAAMLTAYWLVAGQGHEMDLIREHGVFHVEAVLNPDGRDRHTQWANGNRAQPFVADPVDREHNEVWPGGRTNHYWFDLNRDWLPLVNPESRARIDFHHTWKAQVVTDYHEMGASSTYFFEPSEPYGSWNPLLPPELYTDITVDFSRYWAEALEDIGALYFTREVFDNIYPGYGSTYPNFLGGLGLVFEQASARGHIQESSHHGVLTFAFAIRNHVRTSLGTVRAAIDKRLEMQAYQRAFFASALTDADAYPVKAWVFGDAHDHALNRAFMDLLMRHRIQVHALSAEVSDAGRTFSPGSAWVVPSRQPMHRLARSIFERAEEFADSVFYDASAWTVSLAFDMPDAELRGRSLPLGERVTEVPAAPNRAIAGSDLAYLIDWRDSAAAPALQHLQSKGVRVEGAFAPFTALTEDGEVSFGRGSLSIPVSIQKKSGADLKALLSQVSDEHGVRVYSAASFMTPEGPDLGSGQFRPVRAPRVLIPMGEGVSSYEAGQVWHFLDQRLRMPVTKVDVNDLRRVNWSEYDVLVLVGGAERAFGARLDALKDWIRGGGTLIAQRSAAAWAARNELTPNVAAPGIGAPVDPQAEKPREVPEPPERQDYDQAREISGAQSIGGSIWEADLDVTHPLGFGFNDRSLPVWRDHSYFFAPSQSPYGTVAQLTEDPHLSGYASERNHDRLAGSPSLLADRLGGGVVILQIDNTNFRGYWRGTNRLFVNGLFFGNHVTAPGQTR